MENDTIFSTALESVNFLTKVDFDPVDLSKPDHQVALYETLCELGIPTQFVRDFVSNVKDIISEDGGSSVDARAERDRRGLKHIAYGFYSKTGTLPVTHKRNGDKFDRASVSDYEDEAEEHGKQGSRTAPIKPEKSAREDKPETPDSGNDGEGGEEEQEPQVVAEPRPGDSEEAKQAADVGSVAAELAVDYAETEAEKDEDEDDEEDE